ncbi:uncharacterized protein [Littorina saxatilis]|uniref:EGF-like domain-containing protein n=1 Tax=Littorina saxatilis TaxID=31220 RepID=A0AAN9BU31_9CAEN
MGTTEQSVEACAETLKMNLPSVHFLFCTLVAFFNAVEACGRGTSEQQTQNGASVSQLQHKKSTIKLSHRHECTAAEKDSAACLNSGVCYAVDLEGNGDRSAFCYCVEKETGARCEQFVYTGQVLVVEAAFDYRLATIVVLSLAGLIGLLAVFLLVVLGVYKK